MSHIVAIVLELEDTPENHEALKTATEALGGHVSEQKDFRYWGGQKGKCQYALLFPTAGWDVGVEGKDGNINLLFDPYNGGNGLDKYLGDKKASALMQQVAVAKIMKAAKKKKGVKRIKRKTLATKKNYVWA